MNRGRALTATLALALVLDPAVHAADPPSPPVADLSAVRHVLTARARAEAPVSVAGGGGYGYTESVLGLGDSHHRLLGTLVVEGAPLPWLQLGLRLDGRYDHHSFAASTGLPADDGYVGEPRIYGRVDHRISAQLDASAQASLLLPGAQAPSFLLDAATPQLLAALTWTRERLSLTGNAGYRIDRSARSVNDYARLTPGDRLAVGVSDFDALLLGAAAHVARGGWDLFGEGSWDLLVGRGAPSPGLSPIRLGIGARTRLTPTLTAEFETQVSPSGRPTVTPAGPAIPIEPRVSLLAGLVWTLRSPGARVIAPAPAEVEVPRASVVVSVDAGQALPLDAKVQLEQNGRQRALRLGPDGRFALEGATPGPARLRASAAGYEDTVVDVELQRDRATAIDLTLTRRLPSGQIRGTVRSFRGKGLAATVHVVARGPSLTPQNAGPWHLHTQDGLFEVNVPPGLYSVTIEASGYAPQSRTVTVEKRGVTVLNADLRVAP